MTHPVWHWWKQRTMRERLLATVVVLIAIGATIEIGLLAPLRVESARIARNLEQSRARLQHLLALASQQATAGETELARRRGELQERRTRAVRSIVEANIDLVAPTEMTRQLEAILVRHPALRVVGMNASGPKPLVESAGNMKSAAAGVYQHGLEVQIEGPYLDLLGYLEALERAPYRLYWRELDMRVTPNGVPVTRLVFFTLSKEAEWLRL
jgi:MSHA biogenesis protein MshJ